MINNYNHYWVTDMSDAKKERLSAFMDGELEGSGQGGAVDQLLEEPELMGAWGRYHLVSDCLKQRLPDRLDRNLAANVSRALQDEPPIVAPVAFLRPLARPVAGFAIAASVAALAVLGVLGVQQQQLGGPHEAPAGLAAAPGGDERTAPDAGGERAVRAPVRPVGGQGASLGGLGAGKTGWSAAGRAPATDCPPRRQERERESRREQQRERRNALADEHCR